MKSNLVLIALTALFFTSCHKDEKQAHQSLEGRWNVTAIESNYGNFSNGGSSIDSSITENGALGTFDFGEEVVDFEYTQNDTVHKSSSKWQMDVEKVNEGFTKVNKYTLTIEDKFVIDVQFGDATKNAEKNAKTAIFSEQPKSDSKVYFVIWLEKE